ncbi:MAG TPA: glycosyltransferase family 4 protein [archaeon]|nr:glycosyltransferase family 4 protein [archaeon]
MDSITMVGTLPPIKGVSDYCIEQCKSLSSSLEINFYNFSDIYPEFLYKGGGTKENDPVFSRPSSKNIIIRDTLQWWNPFSWIGAGFGAKGPILHFHWWTFYLFYIFFPIALIAKLRGKKIVCTVHNVLGHESGWLDALLCSVMFLLPDKFIVHTKTNAEQLKEIFKISKKRIEIIPHGIYTFYRDKEIPKKEAREKLNIPKAANVILFFGNIRQYKGVEDLIVAFAKAREKVPNLYLIIAGKPWDKNTEQYLAVAAAQNSHILPFLGYVRSSEIKYYFSATDIVILPYKEFAAQSGPGNIALAFEKPIIASNVGGLPELVLNKKMVFESGNREELSDKIALAFNKTGLLASLAADSSTLMGKYSWGNISAATLNVYNELVAQK